MGSIKKIYAYVDIVGLSENSHSFEFILGKSFFDDFGYSDFYAEDLTCKLNLHKRSTMIQCDFTVSGPLQLTCDRSLKTYEQSIHFEKKIIYRYGDEHQELNEDLFVIPRGLDRLIFDQLLFDLIALEIPMKKIHPSLTTEDDEEDLEDSLFYSSNTEGEILKENNDICDPRWEALKKFKQEKN